MRRSLAVLASVAMLATVTAASEAAPTPSGSAGQSQPPVSAERQSDEKGELVGASAGVRGRDADDGLGDGDAVRTYLVQLAGEAVPSYRGGRAGFARTARVGGGEFNATSRPSIAYANELDRQQGEVVGRYGREFGRDITVNARFQYALNGLSVELTPAEARRMAQDPGVAAIGPEFERELQTDVGPEWIGADEVWNGSTSTETNLPADYLGEGIVVGIIDSGINPSNPSFAATGADGYTHTNPKDPDPTDGDPAYFGVCDPDSGQFDPLFPCNDKLIGAWSFKYDGTAGGALDDDGHGSHTGSTAAGNFVDGVTVTTAGDFTTQSFDIKGVAPHANVISYMGCCTGTGLISSIDQAIIDGVDVINYSIGSDTPSGDLFGPQAFDTVGFLEAREAGIFVATSNGNAGPGFATTGSPSDAPWIISVGASTHNRRNVNSVIDMTGGDTTPPADIFGKGVTDSLGSTPIIHAGDFDDPLCLYDGEPNDPVDPDEIDNTANFTGVIVVCDRGEIGRVAKSVNVAAQGAAGFVLANDEPNGDSLNGDGFAVPGVHISFADGVVLKTWLATGDGHTAAIGGVDFAIDDAFGDEVAGFSSRGPNQTAEVIVPDVTAPGVDVLAAYGASIPVGSQGDAPATTDYTLAEWDFLSGTSMASPHTAGAGALLTQARPAWTPAEMQSALMMTAVPDLRDSDGTPADPYDIGAGRIDVAAAVNAGLLLDEDDYRAANPLNGGDFKTLNLPSFNNLQCLVSCAWDRVAMSSGVGAADATVTWTVTTAADDGLSVALDQQTYVVESDAAMPFSVTATIADGVPTNSTLFGRITLTPDVVGVPAVTMPVAVQNVNGILPAELEIRTRRDAGSRVVPGIQSIAVDDFTGTVDGLVAADISIGLLAQDTVPAGASGPVPYDDTDDAGVEVFWFDVEEGTRRFVNEILTTTSPDIDLFVGFDEDGEMDVDEDEEVDSSASGGSAESVDLLDPQAGDWWVLVQNWEASDPEGLDVFQLATAIVPVGGLDNAQLLGPEGPVGLREPYDITFAWDLDDAEEGDRFYGFANLGSSPESAGDIGSIPVTLIRIADDVTKTVTPFRAEPGDIVRYDVDIAPNITSEDLAYSLTDVIPDGVTYVEGSATNGAVVEDGVLTFEALLPTAAGAKGTWTSSTPADDEACAAFGGYADLAGFGFTPIDFGTPVVDSVSQPAAAGPYEFYDAGPYGAVNISDDGFLTIPDGYDPVADAGFIPQDVPDENGPNGVIAPLWHDLLTVTQQPSEEGGDERGITVTDQNGFTVVEWDDPIPFSAESLDQSVGDFQVWLYDTVSPSRPEVTLEYSGLNVANLTQDKDVTIGVEDENGVNAFQVFHGPASTLTQGDGTICLDYEPASFPPASFSFLATVDDAPFGTRIVNEVEHINDAPFAQVDVATATLDLAPNQAPSFDPVPSNTSQSVVLGEALTPMLATDPDGDPLFFTLANGTLPPGVTLEPDGTFTGVAAERGSFSSNILVTDGELTSTTPLVVTVVNQDPDAVDDSVEAQSGVPVPIAVLDNDTDADQDSLIVTGATEPENGTVTCDDTTCTYTSDDGYEGVDMFDYTIDDGNGGSDTATVSIGVGPADVPTEEPTDIPTKEPTDVPTNPDPNPDPDPTAAPDPDPNPTQTPVPDPDPTETDAPDPDPTETGAPDPDPTETDAPEQDLTPTRVAGEDRYETSIQLAQLGWEDGSADTAILVRGDEYPDALAGVTMGAAYDAPVLQNPNDTLREDVAAELERLGVSTVIVLGGELAISSDVSDELDADYEVVRLAGGNRFATAAKILETLTDPDLVSADEPRYEQGIVTLGTEPVPGQDGWVDALSAGTLATTGIPVVLTRRDTLPEETAAALTAGVIPGGRVYVIGGPVAVSDAVLAAIANLGFEVERVAGENRYATSVAAVKTAVDAGASLSTAIVASGRNYPDALSGAVTAWKLDGFLTLVEPTDLAGSPETRDFLVDNADSINRLYVAGGPVAISDQVVTQLRTALGVR